MKHLIMFAVVFLVACGGGGGGGGGGGSGSSTTQPTPQPVAAGEVKIACAAVYNEGQEQCITITPGAQVWLGSVDRDRVMFLTFRVSNTTPGEVRVAFETGTTLGRDGCAGSHFLSVVPIAASAITISPGQFTQVTAALYCPGAEIRQHQFQPTISVNGQRLFIDGVFDVAI